jgi:hypothetical protein
VHDTFTGFMENYHNSVEKVTGRKVLQSFNIGMWYLCFASHVCQTVDEIFVLKNQLIHFIYRCSPLYSIRPTVASPIK